MISIAWDVSHQEFTIEDHYYFSILKKELIWRNAKIIELKELRHLDRFNVLVINYPEKPFNRDDLKLIEKFITRGGRVIAMGYYNNEDCVADVINTISTHFGLKLLNDVIIDEVNNDNDKYFIITKKVFLKDKRVSKVLMPCTASIEILDPSSFIIIMGEKTARSSSGNMPIIAAGIPYQKGEFILVGTCVFCDNYSIEKFDNKLFALRLFLSKTGFLIGEVLAPKLIHARK